MRVIKTISKKSKQIQIRLLLFIFCIEIWSQNVIAVRHLDLFGYEIVSYASASTVSAEYRSELSEADTVVELPSAVLQTDEGLVKKPLSVEELIRREFGEDWKTALAIFKGESGLRSDAIGWNCRYKRDNGTEYSAACKVADRYRAWSVDCGIAQINTIGQECPAKLFDPEHNLSVAKEMHSRRGFQPWVQYTTGLYKKHLN